MARTAKINFQRVTFSFPKRVVDLLRDKIGKGNVSEYVAGLVERDIEEVDEETEQLFKELDELQKNMKFKTNKSSLEILREIRYGNG